MSAIVFFITFKFENFFNETQVYREKNAAADS